jgi:Fe-S-cluster-containing hydrogenase component 2
MYKTVAIVDIIDENCVGCTLCINMCPSDALHMEDRLAILTEDRCVGCFKCMEACIPYGAIKPAADPNPRVLHTPPEEWKAEAVEELCAKAYFDPDESICTCTRTTAGEVAAAIDNGTDVVEELCLETGVRAKCGMWCLSPVMRLLAAAGVETERPAKDYRVYPDGAGVEVGLWSVSDEVAARYPEYPIEEDRRLAMDGGLKLPHYPSIRLEALAEEEH